MCFNSFIPCTSLPGLRGGNRLAGGSLFTVAAILVCIHAERKGGDLVLVCVSIFIPCTFLPGLREGNLLAGDSLLTVAAVFVRIQAEREGRDFVYACFNN